ncbi:CAF17-like 4Fe-4S cluster assembly/insertion protein YgfZ [Horticoccus sp. 23ND18S-11]
MPITITTSPTVFPWQPAALLRVAGDDAAGFLQGQFTNDLRVLPEVGSVYGLWLTLKGKVLADSFVLRRSEENAFWIGSYFSPASVIRERIESHVIADDVTVDDVTSEWSGLTLSGDAADIVLPESPAVFSFKGRRSRATAREWMFRTADGVPESLAAVVANARTLGADEVMRLRIEAGIPAVPLDVGPADLPNEAGLEADAISYTKGCYLGQEVMARLKAMGQVRRRLLRVAGTGDAPRTWPAPLYAESRLVGELRSAVGDGAGGWIGWAMLTRMHVALETGLALAPGGTPAIRLTDSP